MGQQHHEQDCTAGRLRSQRIQKVRSKLGRSAEERLDVRGQDLLHQGGVQGPQLPRVSFPTTGGGGKATCIGRADGSADADRAPIRADDGGAHEDPAGGLAPQSHLAEEGQIGSDQTVSLNSTKIEKLKKKNSHVRTRIGTKDFKNVALESKCLFSKKTFHFPVESAKSKFLLPTTGFS